LPKAKKLTNTAPQLGNSARYNIS